MKNKGRKKELPPVRVTFNPPPSREVLEACVVALAKAAAREDDEAEQVALLAQEKLKSDR